MEPLSLAERNIISMYRHYPQVVKIESNSGRQREHTQSCIKGCSIVFDHDAPRVCTELLNQENMLSDICVHFVGPKGSYDTLLRKTMSMKTPHLFARAHVAYQWLAVLRKINPLYKNQPELPTFNSFSNTLAEATENLVNNTLATEDKAAAKHTEIARDDVSGIQATSNIEQIGDDSSDVSSENHDSDGTLNLRYSYLISLRECKK